jgi:SAM-dependent methyltransferase
MQNLHLPQDYVARAVPDYFDDSQFAEGDLVYQPEVYEAADYLSRTTGRSKIIDFGCGCSRKLRSVSGTRHIGVDFGLNIESCKARFPDWGEWIEADFSSANCQEMAKLADDQSIVICSDVIEHLTDPSHLAALLKACFDRGAIVLTSTPDRVRLWGEEHKGPPPNPAHIREWALDEYVRFLGDLGLPTFWAGYTYNNNIDRRPVTILTIHDPRASLSPKQAMPPLAILSAFNEEDVIGEVIRDWIEQGCDVHVLDNWSTDTTHAIASAMGDEFSSRVTLERFPAEATTIYQWEKILRRKEEIAAAWPGRWIIHTDADEIRRPPSADLTMAQGLAMAEAYGSNRINFNLVNYRPTSAEPFAPGTLRSAFQHFEFGTLPGHFVQAKAWIQGSERVDLAGSAGHNVQFSGATDFPYKFLLRHYPIRSQEHGKLKILTQRRERWDPKERARGWHVHYDHIDNSTSFVWNAQDLHAEGPQFWADYGYTIMTDALQTGLRRAFTLDPK